MALITWTNVHAPIQWLFVLSNVSSEICAIWSKKPLKYQTCCSHAPSGENKPIIPNPETKHNDKTLCACVISSSSRDYLSENNFLLQSSAPNDASWCQLIIREQQWGLVFWWHEAGWERKREEEPQHHQSDCRQCCLEAKQFSTFVCTCSFVTLNSNDFHAFLFVPTFFFLQTWHLLPKATLMHWSEWVNWPVRVKDPKI